MNLHSHSSDAGGSARGQNSHGAAWDSVDFDDLTQAEAWVLSTEAGRGLLQEVGDPRSLSPAGLEGLRKHAPPGAVSAAVRLALARQKAALKFERGSRMWVDSKGVQQSTAEPVARHKASRFRAGLVVDLCAGIGGDTLALAAAAKVVSVDIDHTMGRRIRYNAEVYGVSDRVVAVRARAEQFAIPSGAWVHLDPDRRASPSRRASRLVDYCPRPGFWSSLIARVPAGAIKLSPAADFAAHFAGSNVEIELISLHGECKEATIWFGELASCRRRATRLPENVTCTDRENPKNRLASITSPGCLIYDPDPSLLRAELLDGFACEHKLNRLAEGVDYLTADHLVVSPFLTAFELQEVSSLDLKVLRRLLAKHEIGALEIKVRGARVKPEELREKLRLRGTRSATLIVVGGRRGGGVAKAILAQRLSAGGVATSSPWAELAMGSTTREADIASPLPSARTAPEPAGSSEGDGPFPLSTG
jgi:nucleotide-binding universal stress UspA family protein